MYSEEREKFKLVTGYRVPVTDDQRRLVTGYRLPVNDDKW